jgi:His-Xaa-Ser system protein HxsD
MAEIVVEFAAASQGVAALRAAAYRLIGQASARIETHGDVHHCRLEVAPRSRIAEPELRARFIDLVTDENLREQIASSTESTRNIILALAFGALARAQKAQD